MDTQVQAQIVKTGSIVVAVGILVLAFTVFKDVDYVREFLVAAATFVFGSVGVSRPGDVPALLRPQPEPPSRQPPAGGAPPVVF
jgi:hypothetical protein